VRRTEALIAVATILMSDQRGRHWGYNLSRSSGIRSGVLYPILHRLLDQGWLSDGWEEPAAGGKRKAPPRRYYELTDLGRAELASLLGGVPQAVRGNGRQAVGLRPELA